MEVGVELSSTRVVGLAMERSPNLLVFILHLLMDYVVPWRQPVLVLSPKNPAKVLLERTMGGRVESILQHPKHLWEPPPLLNSEKPLFLVGSPRQ